MTSAAIRSLRGAGLLIALLTIRGSSYFIGRTFLAEAGQAAAQARRPMTPEEHGRLVAEDRAKPRFVGELNGFRFFNDRNFDAGQLTRDASPKCTGTNSKEISEAEAQASRLQFAATYPAGARHQGAKAAACDNDVVALSRQYRTPSGGWFQVSRWSGSPLFPARTPRDRLDPGAIGVRPAVVVHPLFPKDRTQIYLRDSISRWQVSCMGIDLDECIKIAEGVK